LAESFSTERATSTPASAASLSADGPGAAPGQLYGFSLQITRTLAHLIRAKQGDAVCIETVDDVVTRADDGSILEQDKSGLAHNPVADRAVDLWKTLDHWATLIETKKLPESSKLVLFVAQGHHGPIVDRLHKAASREAALVDAGWLRDQMWGPLPERPERARMPRGISAFVEHVLTCPDDVLDSLITGFCLENGSGSPNDDLLPDIARLAVSDRASEDVLRYMLGWVKRAIDERIEKGEPRVIFWDDFHQALVASAKNLDRADTVLAPTREEPGPDQVERELRSRTYVRQLNAIELAEADLRLAVNDFLRAGITRTEWSERGDVQEDGFSDFSDSLERSWRSERQRVETANRKDEELDRGRLVHAYCMGLRLTLQGKQVPSYFVPGSFHTLAEVRKLGWHPRYQDMLSQFDSGEGD
jgi:hypothetical protein